MADWPLLDREWPPDPATSSYTNGCNWSRLDREWSSDPGADSSTHGYDLYYQERPMMSGYEPPHAQQFQPMAPQTVPSPTLAFLLTQPSPPPPSMPATLPHQQLPSAPGVPVYNEYAVLPKPDNPRQIRKEAEKQRRDKLNHSIAELASIVPPVVASNRKVDKTGILRLTAHYLRAHRYVFGKSLWQSSRGFRSESVGALLGLLKGFLLTTTYKGLIVVVSQNVQNHLGYTELELLGQSVFSIVHVDDHQTLRENLRPKSHMLGPNGELLIPDDPDGVHKINEALSREKRRFVVRFKKHGPKSQPVKYVQCVIEGSLRKSDHACHGAGAGRCCRIRRARARGDNPRASGNDVVFIGVVRPMSETFMSESTLESYWMEYRTRHSIDGVIIQCEQRIALATGYMTHEVNGANAMNFMHRDDVRWVIIALREMYDQHRLVGESCYRLMTKSGQFIYMRTRGVLDVDEDSRAVHSFVCTNTVVDENEGKHLIKMMKKKFMLMINNSDEPPPEEETTEGNENKPPVEDPRALEKIILHLVTNLPAPKPENVHRSPGDSKILPLTIIPPKKERIISSIDKIYNVIKICTKDQTPSDNLEKNNPNTDSDLLATETDTQLEDEQNAEEPKKLEAQEKEPHLKIIDVMPYKAKPPILTKDIEPISRLYRFFLSRNITMDRPPHLPPIFQPNIIFRPVSIYQRIQPRLSQNDIVILNRTSTNEGTPFIPEPTPGPSGVKRRHQEMSHGKIKMRKSPENHASKSDDTVGNPYSTPALTTITTKQQTVTQALVSYVVPFIFYPVEEIDNFVLPNLLLSPNPVVQSAEMGSLPSAPVPKATFSELRSQEHENSFSELRSPQEANSFSLYSPDETPEQALKDLAELSDDCNNDLLSVREHDAFSKLFENNEPVSAPVQEAFSNVQAFSTQNELITGQEKALANQNALLRNKGPPLVPRRRSSANQNGFFKENDLISISEEKALANHNNKFNFNNLISKPENNNLYKQNALFEVIDTVSANEQMVLPNHKESILVAEQEDNQAIISEELTSLISNLPEDIVRAIEKPAVGIKELRSFDGDEIKDLLK